MNFNYTSIHFPTGTVVQTDIECASEIDFFKFLNQWNHMGGGEYLYISTKAYPPASPAAHDFKNSVIKQEQERTPQQVNAEGGWWTASRHAK